MADSSLLLLAFDLISSLQSRKRQRSFKFWNPLASTISTLKILPQQTTPPRPNPCQLVLDGPIWYVSQSRKPNHPDINCPQLVTTLVQSDIGPRPSERPPSKALAQRSGGAPSRRKAQHSVDDGIQESVPLPGLGASKKKKGLHTAPVSPLTTPPVSSSNATQNTEDTTKLLASNVRVSHLPAFATLNQDWKLKFLPTLYFIFYNSLDTFNDFALSSQSLLDATQSVVDVVYPNVTYRVRMMDEPFYLLVCRCSVRTLLCSD